MDQPPTPAPAPPTTQPKVPQVSVDGDTNVFLADLRDYQNMGNQLRATLVLTNNQHLIWYIVTVTPTGRTYTTEPLPTTIVLPACSTAEVIRFTCTDVSVATLPVVPNNALTLFADGVGQTDQTQNELLLLYAGEVVWRAAFGAPLRPDVGQGLGDLALNVASWEESKLGSTPVVGAFWKIGKAVQNKDPVGIAGAVNQALTDPVVQQWLAEHGVDIEAQPVIKVGVRVEQVVALDIGLLVDKWFNPDNATGMLNIRITE